MTLAKPILMQTKLAATIPLLVTLMAAPVRAVPATPDNASVHIQQTQQTIQRANPSHRAALGTPSEDRRYASREAASPEARKYRGGDVIVISASALAIILIVLLIILLI